MISEDWFNSYSTEIKVVKIFPNLPTENSQLN